MLSEDQKQIALWCKKKKIEALKRAKQGKGEYYIYWDAKAQAFSQVWEFIVFPEEYNSANELWSQKVNSKTDLKLCPWIRLWKSS